jgi:hypothetical protein
MVQGLHEDDVRALLHPGTPNSSTDPSMAWSPPDPMITNSRYREAGDAGPVQNPRLPPEPDPAKRAARVAWMRLSFVIWQGAETWSEREPLVLLTQIFLAPALIALVVGTWWFWKDPKAQWLWAGVSLYSGLVLGILQWRIDNWWRNSLRVLTDTLSDDAQVMHYVRSLISIRSFLRACPLVFPTLNVFSWRGENLLEEWDRKLDTWIKQLHKIESDKGMTEFAIGQQVAKEVEALSHRLYPKLQSRVDRWINMGIGLAIFGFFAMAPIVLPWLMYILDPLLTTGSV